MTKQNGQLARAHCGVELPLKVLRSAAGFFIGTEQNGEVYSRESEYFATRDLAETALATDAWSQRAHP